MEVCAPCDKVVSESVKAYSADLEENLQREVTNCMVSNLENCITEKLHIDDAQQSESITNGDAVNIVKEGECLYETIEACPGESSCKGSDKCIDSPCNNVKLNSHHLSSDVKEDKAEATTNADVRESAHEDGQPDSLPLLSAMKGSREKQGLSPRKLRVTWAPEVYDPIPTSVSHSVTRGKNKHRLPNKRNNSKKKNGKNKQKGNTSRGSGGKDKKQSRKAGIDSYGRFMDPSYSYEDFEVGSPNLDHCGSGFLIESLTKVHYSTAEAL